MRVLAEIFFAEAGMDGVILYSDYYPDSATVCWCVCSGHAMVRADILMREDAKSGLQFP